MSWLPQMSEGVHDIGNVVFPLILMYLIHFGATKAPKVWWYWPVYCLALVVYGSYFLYYFSKWSKEPKIEFYELALITLAFGGYLFLVLSELLRRVLAPRLTASRGDKWTKEMDYVYLAFAAVGVVWSIDRMDIVNDAIQLPSFVGPFLIAFALVIRALKTRAEIGGWNKPIPPAAPPSAAVAD